MVHNALAATGDDLERRYLGFAVSDEIEGGGRVSDCVGPERGWGAREQHVILCDVGDHADASLGDTVDGFGVGRTGCMRDILTL